MCIYILTKKKKKNLRPAMIFIFRSKREQKSPLKSCNGEHLKNTFIIF